MTNKNINVNVIGAGLAGSESALYLAKNGFKVNLYEMKPKKFSDAHKNANFGELVCSNSLKATDELSASGLLKKEIELLGSSLLPIAYKTAVPSGGALSVDREKFAEEITKEIKSNPNITIINEIVESFDTSKPTIVAAGPLCDEKLFKYLQLLVGEDNCYFYDAIAPIVSLDSIDMTYAYWGNRYDKGETKDYLNCYLTKDAYDVFYKELVNAKCVELHNFEKLKVFEGCMPVEVLAKRDYKALTFGPMKPVGIKDPKRDTKPYAVVQLRKETINGDYLNLVGFQTNLLFGEQKRVFSLIPALKNAEFVRYGTMHRNSYINAPKSLTKFSSLKNYPNVFIAGQISGVEGYMESISSGLFCAINMAQQLNGKPQIELSPKTCLGAIINYITTANPQDFQPMNANYGIIDAENLRDKEQKKKNILSASLKEISEVLNIIKN